MQANVVQFMSEYDRAQFRVSCKAALELCSAAVWSVRVKELAKTHKDALVQGRCLHRPQDGPHSLDFSQHSTASVSQRSYYTASTSQRNAAI